MSLLPSNLESCLHRPDNSLLFFLPTPFVNLPGSLFSKESGRMRHTRKVSFIRVNMIISCLALVTHKIYITPVDFTLPDKTILLLSGWHISPISSAARTSQHSHFGAKITSPRTVFARWLNGEDNLPPLDGVRDFGTLLNFFRFSHVRIHST